MPFAHASIGGRINLRIAEIYLSDHQACFFGTKVGGKLHLLRLEDNLLTPLRFSRQFAAAQHGSASSQVGVATGELTCEPLFISNRRSQVSVELLSESDKAPPGAFFRSSTYQLSFDGVLAGLRCRDLGLSLIDSSKSPLNAGVLQLALAKVVVDSSSGGLHGRARLRDLGLIIAVLQFNQ